MRLKHEVRALAAITFGLLGALLGVTSARAQDAAGMEPGDAFITRFSGTKGTGTSTTLDLDGVVGAVIGLGRPGVPAQGQQWLNEPRRFEVKARDAGQIFGVALDAAEPPNVYVSATAAFGLHRKADNSDWMPGMWGGEGGPGTIYRLQAANGYKPEVFAEITLDGRPNTGAALGAIAFDRYHNQLLVSDLETGMIHRINAEDGQDMGHFDHGQQGRGAFFDVESGEQKSLGPVAFDATSAAQIEDCKAGAFSQSPECWNIADFRRRIWGLDVRQDAKTGETRLYYATWGSNGLGNPAFAQAAEEDKRNWVWSIALTEDGGFDAANVTREFALPDFFSKPADISKYGFSQPVSDIAFPSCGEQTSMLVSERGGLRNRGLKESDPFAYPHTGRVLRYKVEEDDSWTPQGRYDVGYYDRVSEKEPRLRANAAGGAAFGYGYDTRGRLDTKARDAFVWMTGDALCSPKGPCFNPDSAKRVDGSQVHGAQGTPEGALSEIVPEFLPGAPVLEPYPAVGPRQSYMIDFDVNVDKDGKPALATLKSDDATKVGAIAIYQSCGEAETGEGETVADATPAPPGYEPEPEPVTEEPPGEETPPEGDLPPDIQLVKTGPAECIAGDICSFTITVRSNGPGTWYGPILARDTMPPGATLANFAPQPEWQCTDVGGAFDCQHDAVELPPGAILTLSVDIIIPPDMFGPQENCVEQTWAPLGADDSPAVVISIESRLAMLGYDPGAVDGIIDDQTVAAITAFQNDNAMDADGLISDTLREALFADDAGLAGDGNPLNDRSCAPFDVLPPPPLPEPVVEAPVDVPPDAPVDLPPPPPQVIRIVDPAPPAVYDPPEEDDEETFIPVFDPPPPCPEDSWRGDDGECVLIDHVIWTHPVDACPGYLRFHHGRCVCPDGSWPHHGQCHELVGHNCPPPLVKHHGRCVCPSGMIPHNGQCKTAGNDRSCPNNLVRVAGRCVCPNGKLPHHGVCGGAGPMTCKRPLVAIGGRCACPGGAAPHHGKCGGDVKTCRPPMVLAGGRCACPAGTSLQNGRCAKQQSSCTPPMVLRKGKCVSVKPPHQCPPGKVWRNGQCLAGPGKITCAAGSVMRAGRCVPIVKPTNKCPPGSLMRHGKCVSVGTKACAPGTHRVGMTCVPNLKTPVKPGKPCPLNTHKVGNACVPNLKPVPGHTPGVKPGLRPCPPNTHRVGAACVPNVKPVTVPGQPGTKGAKACPPGTHRVGNACVANVKPGVHKPPVQVHKPPVTVKKPPVVVKKPPVVVKKPPVVVKKPPPKPVVKKPPPKPKPVVRKPPPKPKPVVRKPPPKPKPVVRKPPPKPVVRKPPPPPPKKKPPPRPLPPKKR